jgi:hypothetical protein
MVEGTIRKDMIIGHVASRGVVLHHYSPDFRRRSGIFILVNNYGNRGHGKDPRVRRKRYFKSLQEGAIHSILPQECV